MVINSPVSVLIVDNETKYIKNLEKFFSRRHGKTIKWNHLSKVNVEEFDSIVLSGGRYYSIVGHEELWEEELELIRKSTCPILGICLGAQLVAYAFGSIIAAKNERTKGNIEISVTQADKIFGRLDRFEAYENHRWEIAATGPEMMVLARSRECIEVVRHVERNIYGVQFHPEVGCSELLTRSILEMFA
jgi:GMP synthase (glutamine-hydrolysing)